MSRDRVRAATGSGWIEVRELAAGIPALTLDQVLAVLRELHAEGIVEVYRRREHEDD